MVVVVVVVVTRRRAILVKATHGRQGTFLKHWNAIGIMPGNGAVEERTVKGRRCCIGWHKERQGSFVVLFRQEEIQPTNNNAASIHSLLNWRHLTATHVEHTKSIIAYDLAH